MSTLYKKRALASSNAAAILKLQKRVRANTPEIKTINFTQTAAILGNTLRKDHLTQIIEGNRSRDRIGVRIKIHSIEIRGSTSYPLPIYLVRPFKAGTQPVSTDLTSLVSPGAMFGETVHHVYKQSVTAPNALHIFTNTDINYNFVMKHTFKGGLVCTYDAATGNYDDVTRNPLFFCVQNYTSNSQNVAYDMRIRFTDA